jgi:hypothetical protein
VVRGLNVSVLLSCTCSVCARVFGLSLA